jgi:hypothetical protein
MNQPYFSSKKGECMPPAASKSNATLRVMPSFADLRPVQAQSISSKYGLQWKPQALSTLFGLYSKAILPNCWHNEQIVSYGVL